MRKHRLCDILFGMVIMALVMGLAVPALAAVANKTLEAHYMDIKLVVDGVPITPRNASGNLVEPFTVNGTTYLPVRAIGEALGKDVKWDGETKTVYVGEILGKINYLVDVCPPYETAKYKEYHSTDGNFFQMGGKKYSNGFTLNDGGGFALINLNGEYSTLKFEAGHEDGTAMTDGILRFYLDGEFLQEIEVKAEGTVQKVSVPLKNALQLKIEFVSTRILYPYPYCGIANAILE